MGDPGHGLTAAEAAERLGVKPATIYAYVSRGVLHRWRGRDGRSRFDPAEVEGLARRGRPRRVGGESEPRIESAVTTLGTDRPYYRGRDALALAEQHEFEEVATWLWSGELGPQPGWRAAPEALAAGRSAQAALLPGALPLERLQVIAATLAATDPLRHHADPTAAAAAGQSLIAGMVECLPLAAPPASVPASVPAADGDIAGTVAARLWPKLAPGPPEPALVDTLRVALVLLADHELAASTVAARVAASVRADPYAAVLAGLGAFAGALHGGVSLRVEALLAEAQDPDHARHLLGQRLRRRERIPGFGHPVYQHGDARATMLLERVRAAAPTHPRLPVVAALLAEAARRGLPPPGVDLALGALAQVTGARTGAGEAVFAIARTAGWLAHAQEQYARPPRPRSRAVPPGPRPGVGG